MCPIGAGSFYNGACSVCVIMCNYQNLIFTFCFLSLSLKAPDDCLWLQVICAGLLN